MCFAWCYRSVFEAWELNPLARQLGRTYGVGAVLGLKAVVMTLVAGLGAYCHLTQHRLAIPYTLAIGGIHIALSFLYLLQMLPR
jgi:hypothetical protein